MNFFELIEQRESVRGYLQKQVEREKIDKILSAGRLSPSACNAQAWKFIVCDDPDIVSKIAKTLHDPLIKNINKFALSAPAFIVIVDSKRNLTSGIGGIIKNKDFTSTDIGIAAENICLAATELGLGTCMMGWFKEKDVKEILNIPKNREVHLIISLGYHDNQDVRKKVRKPFEDVVSYNTY